MQAAAAASVRFASSRRQPVIRRLPGELPPGVSVRSRSGVVGEGGEGGGGQGETLALEVEGDEPPDPKDTSY